ncbi:hypothetical protein TrRE_jg7907 [Triparma retinervis]|uniref:DUF4336 domain-containing protein n=1 Tax=Triparma retinervis TaxID=2557542 RepID=A0A9W6ZDZ7_9STRA|nr:hypothetical protein TrRE_jg7907 [Triparma retinervis]
MRDLGKGVYVFDQIIGIYYVQLPIRMTVLTLGSEDGGDGKGLFVYAPIAPTEECLKLLQPLIDKHGPVKHIVLPSVAVEHKVNAGPFARRFPAAEFYAVDRQYSFPVDLPPGFLGLPSWTKKLPPSSDVMEVRPGSLPWDGQLSHEVITVLPGVKSAYQDAAFYHKSSKTLLVCDAVFGVTDTPPEIMVEVPEYRRALLFHARDNGASGQLPEDTADNRRKGWKRIVLLFNFFFPGAADVDLGLEPLKKLRLDYPWGWGGWQPVEWRGTEDRAFSAFSAGGRPTVLPIIEIILSRGDSGAEARRWVDRVTRWDFERVVPAHLDAELKIGREGFREAFEFAYEGRNKVRFCDEDARFLREAEEGFLNFAVYKSELGVLRGEEGCSL